MMTNLLKPYRQKIDALDDQIVDLLAQRMDIIREVAVVKNENNIPAVLPDRVTEVIERCAARAEQNNVDPALVKNLYTDIVQHCCDLENKLMKK